LEIWITGGFKYAAMMLLNAPPEVALIRVGEGEPRGYRSKHVYSLRPLPPPVAALLRLDPPAERGAHPP
jgi:hypothetical protein